MSDGNIDGWIMVSGGSFDSFDIGMINGVELYVVSAIHDEVERKAINYIIDSDFTGDRLISFKLSNIYFCDGQMSFPETGQWDFPPHFEFDFTVTKNEIIEESL